MTPTADNQTISTSSERNPTGADRDEQPERVALQLPSRLGAAAYDHNQVLKSLRSVERGLRARLISIAHDACVALQIYHSLFPHKHVPLFANARAGSWYVPPLVGQRPTRTAAFKSADGHYGQWSSSLRRPNVHVLHAALTFGAVVLVDVTRRGKRYPDSFTKTVPIWCAVINNVAALYACKLCEAGQSLCDDCGRVNVHPDVPESERVQIHNRLPEWLRHWRRSIHTLQSAVPVLSNTRRQFAVKPLRPLWVNPESSLWQNGIPLHDLDFTPVVCISASHVVPEGERSFIEPSLHEQVVCGVRFPPRPVGFAYVQGAGDDEEAWCCGLPPQLFWKEFDRLLNIAYAQGISASAMDAEERLRKEIAAIISQPNTVSRSSCHMETGAPIPDIGRRIWDTRIILRRTSVVDLPRLLRLASAQELHVIVMGTSLKLVFNKEETPNASGVDWMPLVDRKGKVDYKFAFGRALGPCLSSLRERCIDRGDSVLICSVDKKGDWCAGLAIAWLAWHCESASAGQNHGEFEASHGGYSIMLPRRESVGFIEKERVHTTMLHFMSTFPEFELSRATLKQLNRFFSSPVPSSSLTPPIERSMITSDLKTSHVS